MLAASPPGGVKDKAGMAAGEFSRCGALLTLKMRVALSLWSGAGPGRYVMYEVCSRIGQQEFG